VVDLCGDRGERVPAPVGVVVLDGFAEALEIGADQGGQGDQQRVNDAGEVDQFFPQDVQRGVGELGEVGDRVLAERRDVGAGELLGGGAALLAAAVFGLAV
jgi:hypothetical protein